MGLSPLSVMAEIRANSFWPEHFEVSPYRRYVAFEGKADIRKRGGNVC